MREYCQPGDPICAPHSDNKDMSKHLDYFTKFGDEAADWVIDLARKAAKKDDKSSSASDLLKKGIAHPVANFMVGAIVLVGLL